MQEDVVTHSAPLLVDLVDAPGGPPVDRWFGCMYYSRTISTSCSWANAESTGASWTQWNDCRAWRSRRIEQMSPFAVATVLADIGRRRLREIALEPIAHHLVIELFRPKQSGE